MNRETTTRDYPPSISSDLSSGAGSSHTFHEISIEDAKLEIDGSAGTPAKTSMMAWIALFFLVFLRTSVSIFNNTFSPIPAVTADYLHVDLTAINWLFNSQGIVYIVVSFGTSWMFERLGVKASQSHHSEYHDKGIQKKGSLASLDSHLSLIIMVAVIASVASLPHLFLPSRPKQSPAPFLGDDHQQQQQQQMSLWKATLTLMKNVHFWVLCGIHSINVGLSISWGGLFNQAITPYGYTNADAGNMVAVGLVAGTLGCLIAGPILDTTKKHILFLKLMTPLMCSTYVAMVFISKSVKWRFFCLTHFFFFFWILILATYPIPESISTSILWQLAQAVGFVLVLVMDNFRDPKGTPANNMHRGLIFQAAMSGACVLLAFVYMGPMLRSKAYQEQLQQRDALLTPPTSKTLYTPTSQDDDAILWNKTLLPTQPQHHRMNSTETISVAIANEPKE
ncbi:hypothetical protein BC940DRAFT_279727 [Gongronella butleri]|nr:hypothetical protein BC940DRAFT_279727 [Gongronella butleri]